MSTESEKKPINGKDFIARLDACKDTKEILALLDKVMGAEAMSDRATYLPDSDLVLNLRASAARFNAARGMRTSREDAVIMAAERSGKGSTRFKIEMNKYLTTEAGKKAEKPVVEKTVAEKKPQNQIVMRRKMSVRGA